MESEIHQQIAGNQTACFKTCNRGLENVSMSRTFFREVMNSCCNARWHSSEANHVLLRPTALCDVYMLNIIPTLIQTNGKTNCDYSVGELRHGNETGPVTFNRNSKPGILRHLELCQSLQPSNSIIIYNDNVFILDFKKMIYLK